LSMKNDKEKLMHHRWGSNNSFNAKVGMDYTWHAEQSQINGEPGYIWLDNARTRGRFKDPERDDDMKVMGFNPCVEQQLEDAELCCLTETFPAKHESYEDYLRTLKIAYLYGKTVTLSNTHWAETNAIMLKNRRIGLSQSGVIQAFNKHGRREMLEWCDKAYDYVQQIDKEFSDWLCVPRSKRTTSIKPSGTVSLLNGSTPGIHYPEAEYYIRRIRFSIGNAILKAIEDAGYHIEKDAYSPNTMVASFPVHEPFFKKGKNEATMWEQLEIAAAYQHYWADNSVSVTVTFKGDEAKDIKTALEMYESRLKAVSFLRYQETGYEQAPYEPITKEQYEEMSKDIVPIQRIETEQQGAGTVFCDGDSCEIG
jgi:ribonucleoside-triphosphate reductase